MRSQVVKTQPPIATTATIVTIGATALMMVRASIFQILSCLVSAQPVDLVGELRRLAVGVGRDAFQHRNAILQPAYLVGELGIVVRQQGDFSISVRGGSMNRAAPFILHRIAVLGAQPGGDRKSTRLNSSH